MGSSSSTLRRRRRVTFRCEPRGPPVPRLGGPPRPGPAGAPVVGPPVRGPPKPPPVLLGPPGRDGAPVRGAPVVGRELIGRGPPGPEGRPVELGRGRRAPGGGGMGRPVALMGRPGGGGMGRPVALIGGRVEGDPPSLLSPPIVRCVGRIVTGPSGDAVRVGAGLAGATLLRTTLGAGASATAAARGASVTTARAATTGASATTAGLVTRVTRAGAGAGASGAAAALVTAVALVAPVAFTALVALAALAATSGCTSRRRPSASARRRMRSACASSIDAEGLEAPIPSFWARPSSSLLVRPSSLESSCTRIFFCAKTFP